MLPPGRLDKAIFLKKVGFVDLKDEEGRLRRTRRVGMGLECTLPGGQWGPLRGGKTQASDHYGLWVKSGSEMAWLRLSERARQSI